VALAGGPIPTLSQQLVKDQAEVLAKTAREQGDASRGAIVFYRAELSCVRCHTTGEKTARLGPDLAKIGKDTPDMHLVEIADIQPIWCMEIRFTLSGANGATLQGVVHYTIHRLSE